MKIMDVSPIPDRIDYLRREAGYEAADDYIVDDRIAEITEAEADALESAGTELYRMCLDAVDKVIRERRFTEFGIGPAQAELVAASWNRTFPDGERRRDPELCARFDLIWDAKASTVKFLEINADTPTTTYECSVIQWLMLEKRMAEGGIPSGMSQFNSLEEKLIARFAEIFRRMPARVGKLLHFTSLAEWDEDLRTTTYLEELARKAGGDTQFTEVSRIGADEDPQSPSFGTLYDEDDQEIRALYKLMPWEHVFESEYANCFAQDGLILFEPAWRAVMSNKMLSVVLWEMFPNHPLLLPSYATPERFNGTYVEKPIFGREGSGIRIFVDGRVVAEDRGSQPQDSVDYAVYPKIYQEYRPLPAMPGEPRNGIVTGLWVVGDGEVAGMDLRFDSSPVTGRNSTRFLPHYMVPHGYDGGTAMKTTLDEKKLAERRVFKTVAVLSAAVAGVYLITTNTDNSTETSGWNIDRPNGETARLIEGRDNCIAELMKEGKLRNVAEELCDKATPPAAHSGGGSSALLWYMIGRNASQVTSYSGNPASGLRYSGGYRDSTTPMSTNFTNTRYGPTSRGGLARSSQGFGKSFRSFGS